MLQLFIFIMIICIVTSEYIKSFSIGCNQFNKKELFKKITSPFFFKKYLKLTKGTNVKFDPLIEDDLVPVKFPQKIKYDSENVFSSLISNKINIEQTWDIELEKIKGYIKSDYISFLIEIDIEDKNSIGYLNCKCSLLDKHYLVPKSIFDNIIVDLEYKINVIINNS